MEKEELRLRQQEQERILTEQRRREEHKRKEYKARIMLERQKTIVMMEELGEREEYLKEKTMLRIEETRRAQEKDSNKITQERVELIKTVSDRKDKLLIFGYVRKSAFNPYKLEIPSCIIEYIVLYRWFLPQWEREEQEKQRQMERALREEAEIMKADEERRKREEIERKNKEIDDRLDTKTKPIMNVLEDLKMKVGRSMVDGGSNEDGVMKDTDVFGDNDNVEGVKLWLKDTVKLERYFDMFMKNGVDRLSVVVLLDKDSLKEIGVDQIGHQLLILNEIEKLKKL